MQSTACQQCGRTITPGADGAGTCASCGWALAPALTTTASITDASTRALPPVVPAPTGAAPASLPSGFTSMETQPVRPALDDDSATRPLQPEPLTPPRTAALPAMAALPPSSGTESRLRGWGMIAVVAVLLAILVVAVLVANGTLSFGASGTTSAAESTPTPTPTPTTPAGFKPYSAPGAYQMNVPADWAPIPFQAGQNGSATAFADISYQNQLVVEVISGPSLPSPQSADDQALTQLSSGKPMQNRQQADTLTLGGQSWTRETADLPVHGTQSHVVALATTHGTQLYLIFYFAPTSSFEVASVADFQPMLNSFAFAQ